MSRGLRCEKWKKSNKRENKLKNMYKKGVNLGIRCTGTCFIQKIYAPYKEEEGAYIF
jgi:hypothetical protein